MKNFFVLIFKKLELTNIVLKYRQFILYSIIGVVSASLDFVIFTFLTNFFTLNYLIANVISVNCGIANSFLLNRHFNFKINNKPLKRFAIFYAVGLLGLCVSSVGLWIFVEIFSLNIIMSKIMVIFMITVLQFSLNKLITFKIN